MTINFVTAGMESPKFAQFLKSVVAGIGKEAVFECQIHGQPAPLITWYEIRCYPRQLS